MGFLSYPAQFELLLDTTNSTASDAVALMAQHLAARFSTTVGCTLSWDSGSSNFEVVRTYSSGRCHVRDGFLTLACRCEQIMDK